MLMYGWMGREFVQKSVKVTAMWGFSHFSGVRNDVRERDSWRDEDEQEEGKQLNFKQNTILFCIII